MDAISERPPRKEEFVFTGGKEGGFLTLNMHMSCFVPASMISTAHPSFVICVILLLSFQIFD